jgi:hypothetical protein
MKDPKIQYRYDPDYDCYYRVYTDEDLTPWDRWGWLAVIGLLTAIVYVTA